MLARCISEAGESRWGCYREDWLWQGSLGSVRPAQLQERVDACLQKEPQLWHRSCPSLSNSLNQEGGTISQTCRPPGLAVPEFRQPPTHPCPPLPASPCAFARRHHRVSASARAGSKQRSPAPSGAYRHPELEKPLGTAAGDRTHAWGPYTVTAVPPVPVQESHKLPHFSVSKRRPFLQSLDLTLMQSAGQIVSVHTCINCLKLCLSDFPLRSPHPPPHPHFWKVLEAFLQKLSIVRPSQHGKVYPDLEM